MKKFVLVPESQHRRTINKSDVLQAIHHPEQREMLSRYQLAENLLHDVKRTNDETKLDEYNEAMRDVALLRDGQTRARQPPPQQEKSTKRQPDNETKSDHVDATVVNALPTSQQTNARKLMQLLRAQGDGVVSWTKNGEVQIRGQRVRGTNIVDLVSDVVRSTPTKTSAPERERFLNALADANVPETLVKNKHALERYRVIKAGASSMDGISDDDDDDNPENVDNATVSSSTDEPSRPKKKRTQKTAVDWNAPL